MGGTTDGPCTVNGRSHHLNVAETCKGAPNIVPCKAIQSSPGHIPGQKHPKLVKNGRSRGTPGTIARTSSLPLDESLRVGVQMAFPIDSFEVRANREKRVFLRRSFRAPTRMLRRLHAEALHHLACPYLLAEQVTRINRRTTHLPI